MSALPVVSVITCVYNGERYLAEAIDSVLGQTFRDFEYILVDDGSTDSTWEIIQGYAAKDSRIIALRNAENRERSFSRNRAIDAARAELIAVLDGDDICRPERLEKQAHLMRQSPSISVCSTFAAVLETGEPVTSPTGSEEIRSYLLFGNPLTHSSVMYRKNIIRQVGGYDCEMTYGEDYDLWCRFSLEKNTVFACLSEPLVLRRITAERHAGRALPQTHSADFVAKCWKRGLSRLGFACTDQQMKAHHLCIFFPRWLTPAQLAEVKSWLLDIVVANAAAKVYDQESLLHEVTWRTRRLEEALHVYQRTKSPIKKIRIEYLRPLRSAAKAYVKSLFPFS